MSIVSVNDGYDGNPIVARAVEALSAFGGGLDRERAGRLLKMWEHAPELSLRETAAVLRRFPLAAGGQ